VATDRGAGLTAGLVLAGLYTAYAIAQIPLAFLRAACYWVRGWDDGKLPPHEDPRGVTKYGDTVLDALRLEGDPDPRTARLVLEIAAGHPLPAAAAGAAPMPGAPIPVTRAELDRVDAFYKILLGQRSLDLAAFAGRPYLPALRAWADAVGAPPAFDEIRMDRAAEFFREHVFKVALILSTSSLLETFACRKGVKVLAHTEFFSNETNRRLAESLQFVLYVNSPGGFSDHQAVNAILRVRLMHAVIRWRVPREMAWNVDQLGVPVNQEDLLGTLMCFSGVVVRDLPKLWVRMTKEEADNYIYLWKVVGPILGIRSDLIPNNLGEALALIWAIERRQQAPSVEGAAMTRALIAFHRAFLGELMDPVGLWMMRRLAGDRVCDLVGVPYTTLVGVTAPRVAIAKPASRWSEFVLGRGPMAVDGNRLINGVEVLPSYDFPLEMARIFDDLPD
jgi:hypothetical protein